MDACAVFGGSGDPADTVRHPALCAHCRVPPHHQLPDAAFGVVCRSAADMGTIVAGPGHHCGAARQRRRARRAAEHSGLVRPATVALIADRLRIGGVLHAATDHPGYAEQIAEVGDAEPLLKRVDPAGPQAAALPISVVRPTTKYEDKARHAGSAVTELLWQRRP